MLMHQRTPFSVLIYALRGRMTGGLMLLLAVAAAPGHGQQPARYVGRLANGQTLSGAAIADWHALEAAPRLDNQALLDPQNPFRWLRDRSLRLSDPPAAFVETVTGDRLPGVAIEYGQGPSDTFDALPPHVTVEPQVELRRPRPWFSSNVRARLDSLRRIVWRKRSLDRYEPGTAFYRDGRMAAFRSVRFGRKSVYLLMDEGQTEAAFDDLAELHFPRRDPWEAYLEELAVLSTHGESRLLQVETTDGLIATASRERFFPMTEGGARDVDRWVHGLQPAWSLDVLWVPHRNITLRRSFAPEEVPLCRLLPRSEPKPSPLQGAGGAFSVNRNIEDGLLESGDQEYGWGFGSLGASELHFPLHDCVTAFQGRVGLDRIVRSGGSIQARVFLNTLDGSPLWQSAPLVGAAQAADFGRLSLPAEAEKKKTLILQIDPLLRNPPPGADPLDIRDVADWLEPMLVLDQAKLQQATSRRTPLGVAAWRGWSADVESSPVVAWRNVFDLNAQFDSFRLSAAPAEKPLCWTRRIRVESDDSWLVLLAEHPPKANQRAQVEVRVEGELVARWEVPAYQTDSAQRQPLIVSLAPFRKADEGPLRLEVLQSPTNPESPVMWRAAEITTQAPTLHRLLEDEGELTTADGAEETSISWETGNRHAGQRSVRIAAPGRYTLRLPHEAAVRERPTLGEYRYIRFAFRKVGQGRVAVELGRREENAQAVRYDAGVGAPSYGAAARVWSLELPDQWIVMTRDLYADFGKSDITSLTLSVPDGEAAFFDHVYLARSLKDFDLIPAAPSPEAANQEARRELAKNVLERVVPATVAIDYGDGRFSTGVLVSREGDVLTAGHAVVAPGKEVTIALRDGRRLKGKTLGVARDLDLGMVRIEEKGEWPVVETGDARNLPKEQLYLGVAHRKVVESEEAPAAHIVGLQRVLDGVIWTDFDLDDWSAGGPLFNKDARLIGVQRGQSRFGGFLYTQLLDVQTLLSRMRNGEAWGAWPAGSGPMMGVHIESLPAGCRITEVYPDTPAVQAGLREGDQVVKINGRLVRRLEDIYARLADANPGQTVALELRRGGETVGANVALIPRTP